jgi:uncharacterized protein (TIGR02246 family)
MKRPEEIADEFQKAWNSHEMAALASLFCEDATFVNRFGHYVRGVQEIVSLHAPIHETIYSDSTMENEVISTIALGDDAAVVHCWSRLTVGKAHPAGPHAVDTIILAVLGLQSRLVATDEARRTSSPGPRSCALPSVLPTEEITV